MAQSVEHIVHIDGVVGSSPTVTTTAQPLKIKGCNFLSPGITAEGFTFFRVHFGDVNGSSRHFVHTVVWLSCRKIGVALLVESGKKASPKRCSGDALNLNNFRVIGSPVILQQSEKRICFN